MRFWALAATIAASSLYGTSEAATVVGDRSRLWPTRTIDFVLCDETGTDRLGRSVCRTQWAGWFRRPAPGPILARREAATVREAVSRWNREFGDNIRLREVVEAPDRPHLVFRASSRPNRCSTAGIGYSPRKEHKYISIGARCNPNAAPEGTNVGIVLHEIMHAVGVYHEQQRSDRSAMLDLESDALAADRQWQTLCDPARQRCDRDARRAVAIGPYDFSSIMHYALGSEAAGTARANLTEAGWRRLLRQAMLPAEVGQRERFSPVDIRAVETLYPSIPDRHASVAGSGGSNPG